MKTAPALALIAVGAILAFAVHAHLRLFSFQIAGWVLMLTGIAGLVIPGRGYSWVRRVTRRPRGGTGAGGAGRMPIGWTFRRRPNPVVVTAPLPDPLPGEAAEGTAPGPDLPTETVEEFFQE